MINAKAVKTLDKLVRAGIVSGWCMRADGKIEIYVQRRSDKVNNVASQLSELGVEVSIVEGAEFKLM